jgi:GT2 family glycosyltransferase
MLGTCIITVLYNSAEHLGKYLKSWVEWERDTDIIFVDNNSSDNTLEIIENFIEDYKIKNILIISQDTNLGFGKANNLGINKAIDLGYKYVLLLNDDIELIENLTSSLINYYVPDSVLSPLQKIDNENLEFNFNTFVGDVLTKVEKDVVKVDFVQAACWFFCVELKNTIGGYFFDEDFFHYGEDNEMIYRVNTRANGAYVLKSASILHHSSVSNRNYPRDYGEYHLNRLRAQALISFKTNGTFHKSLFTRLFHTFLRALIVFDLKKCKNLLSLLFELKSRKFICY